jgi:hypothetical protein
MDTKRFEIASHAAVNDCDSFPTVKRIKALYFMQAPVKGRDDGPTIRLHDGTEIPKLTSLHPGELEDYRVKLEQRYADWRAKAQEAAGAASMQRPLAAAVYGKLALLAYEVGERVALAWAGGDEEDAKGLPL